MESSLCKYYIMNFPEYRVMSCVIYSIAAIPITVLNSLILISIWKTPSLHNPSYALIASLALSDLFIGAIGAPLMATLEIAALKDWEHLFCYIAKGAKGISYWMASVSLYTLAAISVDRLLAIRLKNRYRNVVTLKRVTRLLMVWWCVTMILEVLYVIKFKKEHLKEVFFVLVIGLIIFLVTITVCYSMSLYTLKKLTSTTISASNVTNEEGSASASSNINVNKYKKSLKTMFLVFVVIIAFYTPYLCMAVVYAIFRDPENQVFNNKKTRWIRTLLSSSEVIVFLNSAMNPLLYLWRMQDIRKAVKTTVKRILRRQNHSSNDEHS